MYLAPPANHALDYRGHQEPDAQIPEILRLTPALPHSIRIPQSQKPRPRKSSQPDQSMRLRTADKSVSPMAKYLGLILGIV
jgi:hypothetical protein